MGANQSNLAGISINSNESDVALSAKLASRHGFQILRVHPNSPVSEAHVQPYFDFIISINGVEVSPDIPNIISEMARNHVNKPLKLTIYNSREDEEREVTIVPRTGWGGEGLLGCAIRFSPLEGVRDRVWHILKVNDNSPAQKAGLIAEEDYVIACPDLLLHSEDEFYQLITQNTRRQVKLIVFNLKREDLREIVIVPDFEWGGEGCLGCDVGSGMIHWIPKKSASSLKTSDLVQTIQVPEEPVAPVSILQAQYQQPQSQSQSQVESPSKDQVVNVNIPSSRPVFNNLNAAESAPVVAPQPTTSAPPITQFIHNHPPQPVQEMTKYSTPVPIIDDIPMPKFTVPSDIIHQN